MCGYWEGDITTANNTESDPFHMTVSLGRMIVRYNIQITNTSGSTVNEVTMSNVPTKAYIYPQVKNEILEDGDYTSITNTLNIARKTET